MKQLSDGSVVKQCWFCSRVLWMHKDDRVCPACIEDPDYLALQRHNETVERRIAKQKGKPKHREDE